MMRSVFCLLTVSILAAAALAESDAARTVADLRERGEFRQAEQYGMERWRRADLFVGDRSDLAIQLALVYSEQALAVPPESRDVLWAKADEICEWLINGWPENPRRVLVEVQRALVSLARGEQARRSHDEAQAIEHLRTATRRFSDVVEVVGRDLIEFRLRPQSYRPADALSLRELESLEANVSFHLARTQRQLGLCYPPDSTDRDDALLQAVERLKPLAQQSQPDDLTWNARVELAAALRELGRTDSARTLVAAWLRENPPAEVQSRLSTGPDPIQRAVRGQHDDVFGAAMTAAAIEHQAGRYASAAGRYRQFALRYPNHSRASAAHQRGILCIADLLRESPPEEYSALATSYETLLREHLAHWPTQTTAEKVRFWLGRLLASQRDWQGALEVLAQVERNSAGFPESLPLLVEALARGGRAAEARALVEQWDDVPLDSTLETLAGIDSLLTHRSAGATDQRELGELALSLVRSVDARRSELDASAPSRLDVWRAAALTATGDRAAALAHYAALASQWPDDGTIQERYAALLADSDSSAELRQALARWQEVESRSRRGGPRWRRARKARIDLLTQLGDRNEAEKLSRLTRLLYPDWDTAPN